MKERKREEKQSVVIAQTRQEPTRLAQREDRHREREKNKRDNKGTESQNLVYTDLIFVANVIKRHKFSKVELTCPV